MWLKFAKFIIAGREDSLAKRGVDPRVIQYIISIRDENEQKYAANAAFRNPQISVEEIRQIANEMNKKTMFPGQQRLLNDDYDDKFKSWIIARTKPLFKDRMPNQEEIQNIKNKLTNINDWYHYKIQENHRFDIASFSLEQAEDKSDIWHSNFDITTGTEYQMRYPAPVIYAPEHWNGWSIRLLQEENDFSCEGNKMGHCVGGYHGKYCDKKCLVFSLRDPNNEPHATIETKYADRDDLDQAYEEIKLLPKFIEKNYRLIGNLFDSVIEAMENGNGKFDFEDENSNEYTIEVPDFPLSPMDVEGIFHTMRQSPDDDENYDEEDDSYNQQGYYDVLQTQGKSNIQPISDYQDMIDEWLDNDEGYDRVNEIIGESNISKKEKIYRDVNNYKVDTLNPEVEQDILDALTIPEFAAVLLTESNIRSNPKIMEKIKAVLLQSSKYVVELLRWLPPSDDVRNTAISSPQAAMYVAYHIDHGPRDDTRQIILNSGDTNLMLAYGYLVEGPNGDGKISPETGKAILSNPEAAYAAALISEGAKDRFRTICSKNPDIAVKYAQYVDKEPNDETRAAALQTPDTALMYAMNVDREPRDDTRNATLSKPSAASSYAANVDRQITEDTLNAVLEKGTDYDIRLYIEQTPDIPEGGRFNIIDRILPFINDKPETATTLAMKLKKSLSEDTLALLRRIASKRPEIALTFASKVDLAPTDITRYGASLEPYYAVRYAKEIDQGPHPVTRWGVCNADNTLWVGQYIEEIDRSWTPMTLKYVKAHKGLHFLLQTAKDLPMQEDLAQQSQLPFEEEEIFERPLEYDRLGVIETETEQTDRDYPYRKYKQINRRLAQRNQNDS